MTTIFVIIFVYVVFRKELRSLLDSLRQGFADFSCSFQAASIESKLDSLEELKAIAKKHNVKLPANAKFDDIVQALRSI